MIRDYEHLPIGIYEQIHALAQGEDNDVAIVALLAGKTEEELMNTPLPEYRALRDGASFLFTQPHASRGVRHTYRLGGFVLRLDQRLEKITTAQYIDFKEYAKAGTDDICKYLAIVLIPDGKDYNTGYDLEAVTEAIRAEMSVPDALAIRSFFADRLGRLTAATLTSFRRMAAKMKEGTEKEKARELIAAWTDFTQSGGGSTMWTSWLGSPAAVGPKYMR